MRPIPLLTPFALAVGLVAAGGCGPDTPKTGPEMVAQQEAQQKQADADEKEMQKQQKGKK